MSHPVIDHFSILHTLQTFMLDFANNEVTQKICDVKYFLKLSFGAQNFLEFAKTFARNCGRNPMFEPLCSVQMSFSIIQMVFSIHSKYTFSMQYNDTNTLPFPFHRTLRRGEGGGFPHIITFVLDNSIWTIITSFKAYQWQRDCKSVLRIRIHKSMRIHGSWSKGLALNIYNIVILVHSVLKFLNRNFLFIQKVQAFLDLILSRA